MGLWETIIPSSPLLASLRARIVKLTRLPNNNRAGANNENRMNVVPSRHKPREAYRKNAGVDRDFLRLKQTLLLAAIHF